MARQPYRLPPGQLDRAVARIMKNEGFRDHLYLDNHVPPVVTGGYGTAFADEYGNPVREKRDGEEQRRLEVGRRLKSLGQDPMELNTFGDQWGRTMDRAAYEAVDGFSGGDNGAGFNPSYDNRSPHPLGINFSEEKAREPVVARVAADADAMREKLGVDASGVYNWDKLQEHQQNALLDARYNSPSFIGPNIVNALQHQEDADWQNKVRYELGINIKEPNRRRWQEASEFRVAPESDISPEVFNTESALRSPVDNLFNSDGYTQGVVDRARAELEGALGRPAMTAPVAAEVPPAPTNEPGNLLNANALPANLLNMSPEELRRAMAWSSYAL